MQIALLFANKEYEEEININLKSFHVKKFIDGNPKKILEDEKLWNYGANDFILIHYSGHGTKIGRKKGICSSWLSSGNIISSDEIDEILSKCKCKIVLSSDSCNSGYFGKYFTGKSPLICILSSITFLTYPNQERIFPLISSFSKFSDFLDFSQFIVKKFNIKNK